MTDVYSDAMTGAYDMVNFGIFPRRRQIIIPDLFTSYSLGISDEKMYTEVTPLISRGRSF